MSVVNRRLLSRTTLVGAAVTGLVLQMAGPASATFPSATNGRISFQQVDCQEPSPGEFVCRSDIDTMAPDGSDVQPVTHVGPDQFAVLSDWSKDGTMLAYDVDDGVSSVQVWVANADGSGAVQITSGDGFHGDPVWTPDGDELAIDTDWNQGPGMQGIWVVPVQPGVDENSPGVRRLTAVPRGSDFDSEPAWSPDGTWLTFTRFKSCHFREHGRQEGIPNGCIQAIFKVRADGTGETQLTPWGMAASYSNWSPDGTRITFDSCDSGKTGCRGDIWVMSNDGTGMTRLTRSPTVAQLGSSNRFDLRNNPDFSPDGASIVFTHWCGNGGTELVTIPATGGAESTLLGCDGTFRNKADWGTPAAD
jgi:Tol biopolymer transport system component